MDRFDELVDLVARLRADGGCPWDRAQNEASLRPYVLEEVHEVLDAIDRANDADLRKELGDVLFQVVMLSRMAEERGAFSVDDVLAGVVGKMISRHPHVFASASGDGGAPGWDPVTVRLGTQSR